MFEPLDTMAEAALALCSGDPGALTGRIAFPSVPLDEIDPGIAVVGDAIAASLRD
jgi:hypothetical protein